LGLGWLLDHYPTLTGGEHSLTGGVHWGQNRNVAEAPWGRCSSRQRHTPKSGFVIGSPSILTNPQLKRSKQIALMFSLADYIGYLATCIICPRWAPFDSVDSERDARRARLDDIAVAVLGYLYYQRTSNDITIQLPKIELKN
jgi:hypothetical protein